MQLLADTIEHVVTPAYKIERLNENNLADLSLLFKAVYGKEVGIEYFQKKYDTVYIGVGYVGFLAYDNQGLLVGYNGVIPCYIEHEGKLVLAAQAADYMTHPLHRYKGMLVELSNLTFALCKDLGINLLFGFPNQHSYHGAVNRLGWKPLTVMACFVIPVKAFPWEKLYRKFTVLNRWYMKHRGVILEQYQSDSRQVNNSVIEDGFAGINRSDDWFKYKSYSSAYVLTLHGAKIWVTVKQVIMIGDAEGLNSANFSSVINSLKQIAASLGIRQIQFHCCQDTSLFELFNKHFKAVPSYPVLFKDFGSAVLPGKLRFTFADIDIF